MRTILTEFQHLYVSNAGMGIVSTSHTEPSIFFLIVTRNIHTNFEKKNTNNLTSLITLELVTHLHTIEHYEKNTRRKFINHVRYHRRTYPPYISQLAT